MDFAHVPAGDLATGAARVHLLARQPDRHGAAARRSRAHSSNWPSDTISSSPRTSVTRKSISTRPTRRPGCCRWRTTSASPDYRRCLVFHSLSKRSNLPGLRSGFVAGDGAVLEQYLQYRTYQGCALPPPTQAASIAAWNDEAHVRANRDQYRAKFDAVLEILAPVLDVKRPEAELLPVAANAAGRRNLHARAVCARKCAGPARQLPVARRPGRQPGPQPRAPGAGGAAGRMRRGRAAHPKLCRIAETESDAEIRRDAKIFSSSLHLRPVY